MRYPPEQIDHLAGEYVVGTLHGRARRRFEALMRQRADVRYTVWQWEQVLYGLTAGVEPVRPPRHVWRGIRRRLSGRRQSRAPAWRPRFAILTAVVAVLSFWLGTVVMPPEQPARMAVFADDAAQALWIISADAERGRLITETPGVAPAQDDRVYELWALPADGAPMSLGVLSIESGRYESALTPALIAAVEQSASLAISLEPRGGSPTGAPTGPVVYQASLINL